MYHVRNEPIHAVLLTLSFPYELVVGLLTPVTRATLDEMCSVSRRVHREDSTDDSTVTGVVHDLAHSLNERSVGDAPETVASEQAIEVNAIDAGRARRRADAARVVLEQRGEVSALEPRGPLVARLLERAR